MNDVAKDQVRTPRFLATVALAVLIVLVVVFALKVVLVLFAGVLYGVGLRAAAKWGARLTHLPFAVTLAVLVVGGLVLSAVGAVLLAPSLGAQLQTLAVDLAKAIEQARERLGHAPLVDQTFGTSAAPGSATPENFGRTVISALGGTMEVLAGLIVIFFIGVYGAAQPDTYAHALLEVTPEQYRVHVRRSIDEVTKNLTRWLAGRLVAMAFVGITTSVAFYLLKIPLWLLLGVLAGLLTFVEYAGAIASAIPPLVLGLAKSTPTALAVLALFTALHVIEGYVLTPLLDRASVRLPPALTLAAQVLLGTFAGALGLTVSTPLFVVAVSAVKAFREQGAKGQR
jgi:predicted PurR-regulated permease PerM